MARFPELSASCYYSDEACGQDLIPFYKQIMDQRNAGVSEIAAGLLALRFFDRILSEDRLQCMA